MTSIVILSGLPDGTLPSNCDASKLGFRTTIATLFGWYFWIMYGPVEGSGFVDESLAGESAGTGAANSVARMLTKSPCGEFSLIVITPVLSSVVIPLMWPDFVLPNS